MQDNPLSNPEFLAAWQEYKQRKLREEDSNRRLKDWYLVLFGFFLGVALVTSLDGVLPFAYIPEWKWQLATTASALLFAYGCLRFHRRARQQDEDPLGINVTEVSSSL